MDNKKKYDDMFTEVFGVTDPAAIEALSKETCGDWDSVHQLNIVALMEEAFDVMLDPEDIMALTSYAKGKEILANNGVEI